MKNSIQPEVTSLAAPSRARVIAIGGVFPVAVAIVATILMVSWLPELPDPIAIHWSGAGADGFGEAVPFVFAPLVLTAMFSTFAVAWSWKPLPSGKLTWNQKFLQVTSVWFGIGLSVAFTASVALQRGIPDARDAPDVWPSLAIGAAIAFFLAAVAWFLLPASESVTSQGTEPRPIDVQGDERVSWSRSAKLSAAPLLVTGLAVLVALTIVVVTVTVSSNSLVFGAAIVAFVSVLALTNFWWRVSADRRGFIVKGLFGWPRRRIPLDRITEVAVVDIDPTREFGGWGWRWSGDGRSGIILRAGEGIEVTQSNGKRFVVTVDDAKTGAGVLAALLQKHTCH